MVLTRKRKLDQINTENLENLKKVSKTLDHIKHQIETIEGQILLENFGSPDKHTNLFEDIFKTELETLYKEPVFIPESFDDYFEQELKEMFKIEEPTVQHTTPINASKEIEELLNLTYPSFIPDEMFEYDKYSYLMVN